MAGGRGAIWTERAMVALILACLGGALLLVVRARMGRVPVDADPSPGRSLQAKAAPAPAPVAVVPPIKHEPPPEPPPPVEDPTAKAVGLLSSQTAQELAAAREADARAEALEAARAKAVAEADGWKRRTMLVKKQVATLNAQAESLERGLTAIDAERDVLEHERDALKAALSKASRRSGYSVLPYKGANGTWRRPIVIECANGGAKLQPKGESFNTLDLSPRIHPRSSPIVRAVARELLHIQSADSPDGAPVVPYLVFLVRPSGVRPYYEARASLEPLGIAFGYELIEERLTVDVPDYDDVSLWDGSIALDLPLEKAPAASRIAGSRDPSSPASVGTGLGSGAGRHRDPAIESGARLANAANGGSPDDFIWPNHGGGARGGGAKPASDPWAQALEPAPTQGAGMPGGAGLAASTAMSGGGVLPDLEPAGPLGGPANTGGGGFPRSGTQSGTPSPGGSGSFKAGGAGAPPTGSFASSGETPPSQAGLLAGPSGGAIPPPKPFGGMAGLGGVGDTTPAPDLQPPSGAGGNTEDVGTAPLASGPQGSAGSQARSAKPGGGDPSAISQSGGAGGGSHTQAGSAAAAPPGSIGLSSPATAPAADGAFEPTSAPPLESSANQARASSASQASQDSLLNSILGSGSSTASQNASASGSSSSPSSSSNSSSASGSSGMPLSSTSSESASAGGADSSTAAKDDFMPPPPPRSNPTQTAIDMPFEITVVCRRNSILLHPGAYVLSGDRLHDRAPNGEGALANELRAIVKKRAVADPLIHLKPSLKFLVEAQGSSTFWEARRQLLFTLPDWPMSFRVSGSQERLTADAEVR